MKTCKAVGIKEKPIKQQFLLQSVMIYQFGCILSIVFGILAGKILSLILKSSLCQHRMDTRRKFSLYSGRLRGGIIPLLLAAKLNPIGALHYE